MLNIYIEDNSLVKSNTTRGKYGVTVVLEKVSKAVIRIRIMAHHFLPMYHSFLGR